MSIAADLIRGHTNTIILARLYESDSYGYKINKAISDITENRYELKEATLYTAFKRLEEDGFISSYWGDEGSGARRRYYTLTNSGRDEYTKLLTEWREASNMIEKLITVDTDAAESSDGGVIRI